MPQPIGPIPYRRADLHNTCDLMWTGFVAETRTHQRIIDIPLQPSLRQLKYLMKPAYLEC